MSSSHKALSSSLLIAALALPAAAQTPATQPPTDSTTVKDSTATPAPKKSRFGGLINKAKEVAGNKAVQGAVKGAAANVACNAVPGAAVAAAATGNAACQNTLMGGLVNKGVAGTAAAMAGATAQGAASKAAGQLGGTNAAAAAGALNTVAGPTALMGKTGLKQAAGSVAAAKASSLTQAAAAAAAARMVPNGGALPTGAALTTGVKAPTAAEMNAAAAAVAAMSSAMGTATTGAAKVETVDFRELKGMLPATLGGLKRTEANGEKNSAMGITVSTAEGRYSSGDDKSISLKLADIGNVNGIAGMAAYAWATHEIDRESDNAYEKTTTYKGYKALEKYNKQNKSGEFSVLVGGRFVVGADGNNVSMDALKAAVGSVDLRKLEGMKGKSAK